MVLSRLEKIARVITLAGVLGVAGSAASMVYGTSISEQTTSIYRRIDEAYHHRPTTGQDAKNMRRLSPVTELEISAAAAVLSGLAYLRERNRRRTEEQRRIRRTLVFPYEW